MDYRDVRVISDNYIGVDDLAVGDYFIEDTYPTVWRVDKIVEKWGAKVCYTTDMSVFDIGGEIAWAGCGFCLLKVEPKDDK